MNAHDFWSRMSAAADRAAREAETERAHAKEEKIRRRLRDAGLSEEKIATLERWITHDDVQKAR